MAGLQGVVDNLVAVAVVVERSMVEQQLLEVEGPAATEEPGLLLVGAVQERSLELAAA